MGANTGFQNENEIRNELNLKMFSDLNENMQNLVKSSFSSHEELIICEKIAGASKTDLQIRIGVETHNFSIKKGTGNAVHQEPVEQFLDYLNIFGANQSIKDEIRFYIWGDGTLDGNGSIDDRLSAHQLGRMYPDLVSSIKMFFDEIKKPLLLRFLADGAHANHPAKYIYYGTKDEGICCEMDKAMDWLCRQQSSARIPVGKLTFQAWNRNINGGDRSEDKRGVIQIKWADIKSDLTVIYNE